MNPSLEPLIYAVSLAFFIIFLWMFPNRIKKIPRIHPLIFICIICVEYLLFTTPFIQKQLADFGLTNVDLTPLSLVFSLIGLLILAFVHIPHWVVVISIIPLTFYVGELAYYDATHFIGPIHDLLMGKLPLSSPSWYGLLPVIGLSLIFRIIPLTLVNLYIVIATIETLGYILIFYVARRIYQDNRWATLTIILILLFHFLVQFGDRNYYLQSTFIRFGIWIPIVVSILSKRQSLIVSSLLLALFWTTDMGLYVVGSYIATLLVTKKSLWPTLSYIVPAALILLFFKNYWAFSLSYGTIQMFAVAIPISIFPWIYLAVPLFTLLFVHEPVIVYLSFFSLFTFTYFTGHSHLNALRSINIPVIILFMWWLKKIPKPAIILILLLPASIWGNQAIKNLQTGNIITTMQSIKHPTVTERSVIGNVQLPPKYRDNFAIISPWDSYYLLAWKKTNPLGSNCLLCYWTPHMAKPLIDTAKTLNVHYLFVDRDRYGYEGRVSWIFDPISYRYRFVETIGNLDVYEKI